MSKHTLTHTYTDITPQKNFTFFYACHAHIDIHIANTNITPINIYTFFYTHSIPISFLKLESVRYTPARG
jgi:hypothetical protein